MAIALFIAAIVAAMVHRDASYVEEVTGKRISNRTARVWAILVFLMMCPFLPIYLLQRPRIIQNQNTGGAIPSSIRVPCPQCAEPIVADAKLCHHCRLVLPSGWAKIPEKTHTAANPAPMQANENAQKFRTVLQILPPTAPKQSGWVIPAYIVAAILVTLGMAQFWVSFNDEKRITIRKAALKDDRSEEAIAMLVKLNSEYDTVANYRLLALVVTAAGLAIAGTAYSFGSKINSGKRVYIRKQKDKKDSKQPQD